MKAKPAQNDAQCEYHQVGYPDPRTQEFESPPIDQIGTWRRELQEVAIDEFAIGEAQGVRPEVLLVSTQQKRYPSQRNQSERQVQSAAEENPGIVAIKRRFRYWLRPKLSAAGCIRPLTGVRKSS
jgi:hypothetical protein